MYRNMWNICIFQMSLSSNKYIASVTGRIYEGKVLEMKWEKVLPAPYMTAAGGDDQLPSDIKMLM